MTRRVHLSLVLIFGSAAAWAAAGWSAVSSPNRGALSNLLNGTVAVADNDAWAVGHWYDQGLAAYRTLVQHWDGVRWQMVASPNAGSGYNDLNGVTALGPTDAWAVGYSRATPYSASRSLILRWDGGAWRVVPSPNPGPTDNVLYGVAALAADDVWAAGWYYDVAHVGRPLLAHWDGARWSIPVAPAPSAPAPSASYSALQAITAIAPDDVWAGGYTYVNGRYVTLLMHWNGRSWTVTPSPNVGTKANRIRGVSAAAWDDVWAVGDSQTRSLVLHWDGSSWSVVDHPTAGTYSTLWGVAAAGGRAYAVGYSRDSAVQPLICRWDGAAWTLQPAATGAAINPWLTAVSAADGARPWAVGTGSNGSADRTMVLRGPVD